MPQLTIHLDLPATVGISRKKNQAELDRMELEAIDFHERVAEGYRKLASLDPDRIKTIDATMSIDDIHAKIVDYVEPLVSL